MLCLQPEEVLGTGIRAHKRSAVDALWAEMNAEDAPTMVAGSTAAGTGRGKVKGKKRKADKKANQVTTCPCSAKHACVDIPKK